METQFGWITNTVSDLVNYYTKTQSDDRYVNINGDNMTGNLNTTGNVTANYFIGDGSQLTGISSTSYWNESGSFLYPSNLSKRVGIGIENPESQLHVNGSAIVEGNITMENCLKDPNSNSKMCFENGVMMYYG